MIISYTTLQSIKPMSKNNRALIEQLIEEVEFSKIQKLMGTTAYNAIVAEVESGTISDELQEILDGGLYKCITYYVYARYIQESMLVDTFTGMVKKQRTDSETAPVGSIKNVVNEYTDMAMLAYTLVGADIQELYGAKPVKSEPNFTEITGVRRGKRGGRKSFQINYFG